MINKTDHPVAWAYFMQELEDAHEHLGVLIEGLSTDSNYSDEELRIDLGHLFAHLNRAWTRKNLERDMSDEEWEAVSRTFPDDLLLVG